MLGKRAASNKALRSERLAAKTLRQARYRRLGAFDWNDLNIQTGSEFSNFFDLRLPAGDIGNNGQTAKPRNDLAQDFHSLSRQIGILERQGRNIGLTSKAGNSAADERVLDEDDRNG
jgi:hypothetical protein